MPEYYSTPKAICLVAHHEAMSSFTFNQLMKVVGHLINSNTFSLAQTMEIIGIIAAASQAAFPADAIDKATLAETLACCARNAIDDFYDARIKFPELN